MAHIVAKTLFENHVLLQRQCFKYTSQWLELIWDVERSHWRVFCFQIHHSTSLRPAIEKHYLNGGDLTTETDYEFTYPLKLGWMTKIFRRDMLTFLVTLGESDLMGPSPVDRVALCPACQYCEIPRKITLQLPEGTQSPTRGWYPWNSQSAFDAVAFLLNTSHNFGNNGYKDKDKPWNIINFPSRSM